jgi:hypothetical protein
MSIDFEKLDQGMASQNHRAPHVSGWDPGQKTQDPRITINWNRYILLEYPIRPQGL